METLFWLAACVAVLALVMIPVTRANGRRIAANARPVRGTVLKVVEVHGSPTGGQSTTENHFTVHIRFPDPDSGELIERIHWIPYVSLARHVHTDFPVGKEVNGFYEPGSPVFLPGDKLPNPDKNLTTLLTIAGGATVTAIVSAIVAF